MLWIVAGVLIIGAAAWGPVVSNVEQAKYEVVETHGAIEIRDYAEHIVAEVNVSGERKAAINEGFRLIADYIFGNNTSASKVAMTAPVIQQKNEKIAMTAPVLQQSNGREWSVQFVMPSNYTLTTLPKPNNNLVKLNAVASKRFAVIRFSGMAGESALNEKTALLDAFVAEKKIKALSKHTFAFYNPPWTLPFLRRNEVMIEIESTQ